MCNVMPVEAIVRVEGLCTLLVSNETLCLKDYVSSHTNDINLIYTIDFVMKRLLISFGQ